MRFVDECRQLLTERGEANSLALAASALQHYDGLSPDVRERFFDLLASEFDPDPGDVLRLAEDYAATRSPDVLIRLTRAAESPRQELFRRLNRAPDGTRTIVQMRAQLLEKLRAHPEYRAVDADMQHLLSSWFNPGFLQLRQVDWRSPALLLEKIIQHEAVHAIDGWSDLRRRLQPDRRLFAFFHPMLPDEPLIFVEVALCAEMPSAIAALLDRSTEPLEPSRFRVATFYSISNCQPGLRGINLGNFLIKRVAEHLQAELPSVRTFCTLSPVPSFAAWLAKVDQLESPWAKPATLTALNAGLAARRERPADPARTAADDADAKLLQRLCAFHLTHTDAADARPSDPVARFHLANGARLERINCAADLSRKGLRDSHGLMVNYLYDLDEIERNHQKFVSGEVSASRSVLSLLG